MYQQDLSALPQLPRHHRLRSTAEACAYPGCCHEGPCGDAWRLPFQVPSLPCRVLTWLLAVNMYRWNLERVKIAVNCWLCGNLQQDDAYLYSRYAPSCPCTASLPAGWVRNFGPISVSVTRAIQIVFPVVKLGGEKKTDPFQATICMFITSASKKAQQANPEQSTVSQPSRSKNQQSSWPAPSRQPASLREARLPASSWPPRQLASPRLPLVA